VDENGLASPAAKAYFHSTSLQKRDGATPCRCLRFVPRREGESASDRREGERDAVVTKSALAWPERSGHVQPGLATRGDAFAGGWKAMPAFSIADAGLSIAFGTHIFLPWIHSVAPNCWGC
jgi:hypothetical protein